MLKTQDISLKLGRRQVLSGIDLCLNAGEVTAILGPNGAGKTSLMRILSGEWTADSGSIEINGSPLERIPIRRLGQIRSYLHQESSLTFAFTVLEVVLLGRSPHMPGMERPVDYDIARRSLEQVDLSDREDDLYTSLSGGEKQRVHLARILAQVDEPSIEETRYLLLDEPTNNLDLSHQQKVYRIVKELATCNVAVCMVIHDLNQAIQTADKVIILENGKVALSGTPAEIAGSTECDRIFGVTLTRIQLDGSTIPYLIMDNSSRT